MAVAAPVLQAQGQQENVSDSVPVFSGTHLIVFYWFSICLKTFPELTVVAGKF